MNAAAPMNDGKTSGSGARTRHSPASGTSLRVSSQASDTPMSAAAIVTMVANCSVRHAGASDSSRISRRSPPSVNTRQMT